MSDRDPSAAAPPTVALGEALRALPPASPPRDGWPNMARRLQRRRRPRAWPLALAATLALGVMLGLLLARLDAPAVPVDEPEAALLTHLRLESARLEALLAAAGPQVLDRGDALLVDQQLALQLLIVDARLGDARPDAQLPLWSQRVALLSRRAELVQAQLLDPAGTAAGTLLSL